MGKVQTFTMSQPMPQMDVKTGRNGTSVTLVNHNATESLQEHQQGQGPWIQEDPKMVALNK